MTAAIETEKKRYTWEDFTLEEHIRAYIGVPHGCELQVKKIKEDVYRVNVFDPKTETFPKSEAIRVITTPDGYVFKSWDG